VKFLDARATAPRLGLALGPGVAELVTAEPGLVDYVEIPFEQLRHAPHVGQVQRQVPVILHCASLSMAGFVPPSDATVDAVAAEARRTGTPWIGEHLAFVNADAIEDGQQSAPQALTYTVCPQLSEETIEQVVRNVAALRDRLPVPLILENSPQYMAVPGSTMGMVDFIGEVARRADVDLLLDLTHHAITCQNTGVDALSALDGLPLERVVEVHVSGLSVQSGIAWDDHASPAPPLVFELLARLLRRVRPRGVTIEYNWAPNFPLGVLRAHVGRVRTMLEVV
jgi:uncharacterized protein (UPF0276 family)